MDAERNRNRILRAALEAFEHAKGDVSMAEISRRAGVGMATLYRNFASRKELIEALYTDEVDTICRAATLREDTAETALITWLRKFFAFARKKRHVAVILLEHSERSDPIFTESRARVLAAGRPLLAHAQRAGEIRTDIKLEHILDMIVALSAIKGEPRYIKPILNMALEGLSNRFR